MDPDLDWEALLARAVRGEGIRSAFQPIVDLRRCVVTGYEALTRVDLVPGVGPDAWFDAASQHGLTAELEAAALRVAFAARPSLPSNCFLTVNVEPESLGTPAIDRFLREQGSLAGVVIEVTEHRPIADPDRLCAVLDRLRADGALVAVDDAGAGYAGLQQILTLRPSILKLDRALVDGIDRHEAKAALVEMIGHFAGRIDAWLLAEGIETAAEARRCRSMGVPLAQGYWFGRPAPPWADIEPHCTSLLADHDPFVTHGLHGLVEVLPCVAADHPEEARALLGAGDASHVVLVDADRRPVGLATLDDLLVGGSTTGLRANLDTRPHDLAHRWGVHVADESVPPVMVTDDAGRYVGVVPLRRLLTELGRPATELDGAA